MIAWLRRQLAAPALGCDACQGLHDCERCGPLTGRRTPQDVRR